MLSNAEKVKEFHRTFDHPIGEEPGVPDDDLLTLRLELVAEEVYELVDEIEGQRRLEEVSKELADLLYVVYGFFAVLGVDADAVFAEVHRSNMSKLGEDGKPIYREDGKVLKGPNYSPADVKRVIYGDD